MTLDGRPTTADAAPTTAVVPPVPTHASSAVAHEVSVRDGRFALAMCTCGWHGVGRRQRSTARAEAHDHALLYADGRTLPASYPIPEP